MRILGISAFYHDSAAALVDDGAIVAAAQEERFTRKKHDAALPAQRDRAIAWHAGGIELDDVDHVVFYDKPFLKFERLLETYLAFAPRGFRSFRMAMPLWLREKLFQKEPAARASCSKFDAGLRLGGKLLFTEHHLSHAASAFFPSPFERGGGADHGRRRRVGDDRRSAIGDGNRPRDRSRRSTSRIRSACSIRPSPTTPASRSIPASTR